MEKEEFLKIVELLWNHNTKKMAIAMILAKYDENRMDVYSRYLLFCILDDEDRNEIGIKNVTPSKIVSAWRDFCDETDDKQDVRESIIKLKKTK